MRVSMLQDNLTNALKLAGKTVAKKSSLPVLECVKIGTENGRIYVETTDLDTGVRVYKGASVEEDGAICVPYKEFAKLVDRLSPERIDIDTTIRTMSLSLSCGASKATFKGIDALDFPVMGWLRDNDAIDVPTLMIRADDLMAMISEVQYAASKEDNRPTLNSISMAYKGNKLTLLASDGRRMAYAEHTFEQPSFDGEFNILVPLSSIEKFKSIFADEIKSSDDLWLAVEGENLFIMGSSTEFVTALTEGAFPDYMSIVFSNDEYTTIVDPISFTTLLKRSEVFSKYAFIKTEKQEGGAGIMRVLADSYYDASDLGSTEGILDVQIKGDTVKSFYSIKHLSEMLGKFDDFNLRLDFKPVIGRDQTDYILKASNGNSWHMLMPEFIDHKDK